MIFFFFNDTATTEIYTLSLHDALPILAEHVDFIGVHLLPYWEGVPVDAAVRNLVRQFSPPPAPLSRQPIVVVQNGRARPGPHRGTPGAPGADRAACLPPLP